MGGKFSSPQVLHKRHHNPFAASSDDEITKAVQCNLQAIKLQLKELDINRQGTLTEENMGSLLRKYGVGVRSFEAFKANDGRVDYIKFLKYYL